ncbi:MAG: hypothetical protein GY781_17875 [Gammaproteobacteria bacterium]|nr:hypothetical protein [Gammaproteobacteria bacterium]
MLNCKDFVLKSAKLMDNDEMSSMEKISFSMHRLMCHHCRKYFKQLETTDAVAKNLDKEPAPEGLLEQSVSSLKAFSEKNSNE